MRRTYIAALAAVAIGGVLTVTGVVQQAFASAESTGAVASRGAPAAAEHHEVTLRFAAKELVPNVLVDVGQPGNSVGDYVIEHETLFHAGRQIGHDTLQCTAIHGPPAFDFQCVGTLVFSAGQVTFQGATDFSSIRIAVTGGTGLYQGAYGELVVHGTQTTTDTDVVHLVLPH